MKNLYHYLFASVTTIFMEIGIEQTNQSSRKHKLTISTGINIYIMNSIVQIKLNTIFWALVLNKCRQFRVFGQDAE